MSWLSFSGRIGRQRFWLGYVLPLFLISIVLTGISTFLVLATGPKGQFQTVSPIMPLLNLLLLWPWLAGTVKRLHDRDRSGWWVLIFYALGVLPWFALVAVFFAGVSMHGQVAGSGMPLMMVAMALGAFGVVVGIWMLAELGFLRGTVGPNRFGPDPLGPGFPSGYGVPPVYGAPGGYFGQGGMNAPPPDAPQQGRHWGGQPPARPWDHRR